MVQLTGRLSQSYEFKIYNTILPNFTYDGEIGGIYCFAKQNSNGNYNVIYIGKTENFKNRLNESHHKINEIRRDNATHLFLHTDNNSFSRDRKERDLITNYNPTCNDQLSTN